MGETVNGKQNTLSHFRYRPRCAGGNLVIADRLRLSQVVISPNQSHQSGAAG
jgi:hypothetical protein